MQVRLWTKFDLIYYFPILLDFSTSSGSVRFKKQFYSNVSGSGPVEVLYHGYWGTICHNGWDLKAARVVCRQLGYQDAVSNLSYSQAHSVSMCLENVNCTGEELSILNCTHSVRYDHSCRRCSVGVKCGNITEQKSEKEGT